MAIICYLYVSTINVHLRNAKQLWLHHSLEPGLSECLSVLATQMQLATTSAYA